MAWVLVAFYVVLSVLAYFAMLGRTPNRRLLSAIGIIAVQIAALVWIQIISRALGSQSRRGSYSLGIGELYLAIRPLFQCCCVRRARADLAGCSSRKEGE